MQQCWSKLLLVGLFLCAFVTTWAQDPTINSPYTRYGLGNVLSTDLPHLQAIGGISAAYNNSYNLNISNPATLGSLNATAFDVGIYVNNTTLQTSSSSSNIWSGNLTHLALGFPLKNPLNKVTETKKSDFSWGSSFGLLPYSQVGYDIEVAGTEPGLDTINYNYTGSGGQYQFFLGNGWKYKNFSAGLHIGYIFGQTVNQRSSTYPTLTIPFTSILTDELNINGFTWKGGLQYEYLFGDKNENIKKKKNATKLTLGITGNTANQVNTTLNRVAERYNNFYGIDTISSSGDILNKATLPSEWSFGAVLSKDNNWLFGVNYSIGKWSEYVNPAKPEVLQDSWRIGFGGQYTPDFQSYNKYSNRVTYRVGGSYGLDPRVVEGEQLTIMALNAGVGFPIFIPKKGRVGYINLALEYGKLSTPSFIEENYIKLNVGFTLNDNTWFYKRKFE